MNANSRTRHDNYSFSLGGQSLKTSFSPVPVIADDRINRAIAERLEQRPEDQPDTREELQSFWYRLWRRTLRRAA